MLIFIFAFNLILFNFCYSKARLPKGVGNIRHHIENVDNVPLHVSLFTDCSKKSTKEMLNVLKDYGEIVCCFGSSHSMDNIELFAEANLA